MGDPIRAARSHDHCPPSEPEHPELHTDAIVQGRNEHEVHTLTGAGFAFDMVELTVDQFAWYGGYAAAETIGHAMLPVSIGLAVYEMCHAFYVANDEGTRDGLVAAAFGGNGAGRPGWALGVSSVLADASPSERAATRGALPEGIDRERFDEAVAVAERGRREQPDGFAEAAGIYRREHRAYTDGLAAGIEGWNDASQGATFQAGRAAGRAAVAGADGNALRAAARADKTEGFRDAMNGRVDARRERRDPHYRSGVHYHGRIQRNGVDAVKREWVRLESSCHMPARATRQAPVRG